MEKETRVSFIHNYIAVGAFVATIIHQISLYISVAKLYSWAEFWLK